MNHPLSFACIGSLLLVSLTGICIADDPPGSLVYIQGGESSITNGSDGVYVITIKDIVPYFHVTDGKESNLNPVELLTYLKYPMSAALVLSGADNEITVMVQVANMSISDGNKVLTLQADSLKYYEGELLKSFHDKRQGIDLLIDGRFNRSGVYLELLGVAATNEGNVCLIMVNGIARLDPGCQCRRDNSCLHK